MELVELIGLKVFALKGEFGEKTKYVFLRYILFSDKKTFLRFEEQDPYSYHDCSRTARNMELHQDVSQWENIFSKTPNATEIY